jgi:hypothetical protein
VPITESILGDERPSSPPFPPSRRAGNPPSDATHPRERLALPSHPHTAWAAHGVATHDHGGGHTLASSSHARIAGPTDSFSFVLVQHRCPRCTAASFQSPSAAPPWAPAIPHGGHIVTGVPQNVQHRPPSRPSRLLLFLCVGVRSLSIPSALHALYDAPRGRGWRDHYYQHRTQVTERCCERTARSR